MNDQARNELNKESAALASYKALKLAVGFFGLHVCLFIPRLWMTQEEYVQYLAHNIWALVIATFLAALYFPGVLYAGIAVLCGVLYLFCVYLERRIR